MIRTFINKEATEKALMKHSKERLISHILFIQPKAEAYDNLRSLLKDMLEDTEQ